MATKRKPANTTTVVSAPEQVKFVHIEDDHITRQDARELIADALNECAQEARGYFGASAIVQALTTVAKRFRGGK